METLYARHEHDHGHDRPCLGDLPRAPDGRPESPIYPSTHDRHYYCCACGHEGRKGGPPRVSLDRVHKLRASMAAAAWRLEGFVHRRDGPQTGGVRMGTWLLMLACNGDPRTCNTVLGPWQEARFGSEA